MALLTDIYCRVRNFLADEDGAAGLEFIATLPLLIGVMVFTAEYGRALRARMLLDGAVQDAARYLARGPVDTDLTGTNLVFYPEPLAEAETLIEQRLLGEATVNVTSTPVDSVNFRTPYYVINVQASVNVDLPLLNFVNWFGGDNLDTTLTMTAAQQARWVGDIAPGTDNCSFLDKYTGQCP